jgi:hypothetical protein
MVSALLINILCTIYWRMYAAYTILCELQGICTVACERDLLVGAPLMSIRHLFHCNLCPWACPSFITSSLGGYSNSSSAEIVYTVSTSTATQSSWIETVCSVVTSGWTRPSASSHWSPLHVIHRPQCVG